MKLVPVDADKPPLPTPLRLTWNESEKQNYCFCCRPGVFAVPERNEASIVTQRNHRYRHSEGTICKEFSQATNNAVYGQSYGQNIYSRLFKRYVLRTRR